MASKLSYGKKLGSSVAYLLLAAVFLFGFYIVIVALLATSWVQLNALTEREEEDGYARLTAVIQPVRIAEIETLIAKAASDPILDEVNTAIKMSTMDNSIKDQLFKVIQKEQEEHRTFIQALETIRANNSALRKEISDYIMNEAAPTVLNSAYSRLDRRLYELALAEQLTAVIRATQREIDELTSTAREIDREWRVALLEKDWRPQFASLASSTVGTVGPPLPSTVKNLPSRTYFQGSQNNQAKLDRFINRARSTKAELPAEEKLNKPDSSEAWGAIGATASWLIEPASIELVYIVGMIGFGILGSSLTTFVGFQVKGETDALDDPSLLEVIGVIVKGITAAIVVFLFIFGGFEVFSNENTQTVTPNAYMLFLTCFLGAVFSDRIWAHARERLTERLKSTQPSSTNSTGT